MFGILDSDRYSYSVIVTVISQVSRRYLNDEHADTIRYLKGINRELQISSRNHIIVKKRADSKY